VINASDLKAAVEWDLRRLKKFRGLLEFAKVPEVGPHHSCLLDLAMVGSIALRIHIHLVHH